MMKMINLLLLAALVLAAPLSACGKRGTLVLPPAQPIRDSRMDHFEYRDGVLHAEDVNLVDLAETVGTPFYCYSTATLRHHYGVLHDACCESRADDTLICYSVKANSNMA